MPPKKKGGKKSAKVLTPTLINGLTKEEISKEQLEEHILRLREDLDRAREERNYFQLERDKINAFREITERQLVELKAEETNLDKEMEEDKLRHQVEIKVYKQKMKHLLCEHQNTISELKLDGLVSNDLVNKEQERVETDLHKEMRNIIVDMQEIDHENLVLEMDLKHKGEMNKTRDSWEQKLIEIQEKYETKMELLEEELDNMRKSSTSEREDQWSSHINALREDHDRAVSEAHAMLESMQQDLEKNTSLKTKIEELKAKQKRKERGLKRVLKDNKLLAERLLKVKEEISENEKKTKYYASKKITNEKVKEKELNELKQDCDALQERFSKLQLERDELYSTYTENIQSVQHKADLKIAQLERKLKGLTDGVEKTQAQLGSVLSASNMDQTALGVITNKFMENLDTRNETIRNLQYRKAQISTARQDLLMTIEAKQRALGVIAEGRSLV